MRRQICAFGTGPDAIQWIPFPRQFRYPVDNICHSESHIISVSRRIFTLGLGLASLSACSGTTSAIRSATPVAATNRFRPTPNPAFDAWVGGFRTRAAAKGISQSTLSTAFRDVGYLPDVIERDRNQTETDRSLEDYVSIAAGDDKVKMGREVYARYAATLARIEAKYGVEAKVVTGVWGVESFFGTRRGDIPVISAVSTLAFDGRRGAFFEQQLMAALRILQRGDTTAANMTGSWAGAMGHTQFIPTSFEAYAVDFTGDGRRDIWSDDPTDALASTAAYLSRSGWVKGQPWGVEVKLPAGFNTGLTGRGTTRQPSDWAAMGVRDMRGAVVPNHSAASIIIPAGASGPAFMTFRNFTAITRYNNAEKYVIGVGHLSDRVAGGGPIQGRYPNDANGMSKADRQKMQQRLTAKGFDTGGTDGVIGPKTRAAISAYQGQSGISVTGEPSLDLLRRLG